MIIRSFPLGIGTNRLSLPETFLVLEPRFAVYNGLVLDVMVNEENHIVKEHEFMVIGAGITYNDDIFSRGTFVGSVDQSGNILYVFGPKFNTHPHITHA